MGFLQCGHRWALSPGNLQPSRVSGECKSLPILCCDSRGQGSVPNLSPSLGPALGPAMNDVIWALQPGVAFTCCVASEKTLILSVLPYPGGRGKMRFSRHCRSLTTANIPLFHSWIRDGSPSEVLVACDLYSLGSKASTKFQSPTLVNLGLLPTPQTLDLVGWKAWTDDHLA